MITSPSLFDFDQNSAVNNVPVKEETIDEVEKVNENSFEKTISKYKSILLEDKKSFLKTTTFIPKLKALGFEIDEDKLINKSSNTTIAFSIRGDKLLLSQLSSASSDDIKVLILTISNVTIFQKEVETLNNYIQEEKRLKRLAS